MQAGRAFRDVGINNVVQPNSFIGPLLAGDQVMIDEYTAYIQDEKARVGLYTAWLWYALAIDLNILLFSSLAMAVAREDAGLRDERPLSFPQRMNGLKAAIKEHFRDGLNGFRYSTRMHALKSSLTSRSRKFKDARK
ncbi:uncharacterized protein FFNC_12059 [Fusarium fujikuroi]|nr:uncharacterized protein FFNC_12059 [Fusarium fujikuroi]SCV30981.1 uncharacterized protein FFFS_02647 [Fusarium fujikuroi]